MAASIEMYKDLFLRGPLDKRTDLRSALLNAADGRWSVDFERHEGGQRHNYNR